MLHSRLAEAVALPMPFRNALGAVLDRAMAMAERVVDQEPLARQAATALYDASSAVLMAWEATRPGADARRALIARCVLAHKLSPQDPLAPELPDWEVVATNWILGEKAASPDDVAALLAS